MTKEELLAMAKKTGKALWKGLQKLSVGAAMIIAAVIQGLFGLIRDYLKAERMPPDLDCERALVFSSVRHSSNKHRAIIFWGLTFSGVVMAAVSGIDKMSGSERALMEFLCSVLLFSIFPAIFFTFRTMKWKMTINNLGGWGGQNGQR
jgi:hypothetical protein